MRSAPPLAHTPAWTASTGSLCWICWDAFDPNHNFVNFARKLDTVRSGKYSAR